jgi:hypothetical protein
VGTVRACGLWEDSGREALQAGLLPGLAGLPGALDALVITARSAAEYKKVMLSVLGLEVGVNTAGPDLMTYIQPQNISLVSPYC